MEKYIEIDDERLEAWRRVTGCKNIGFYRSDLNAILDNKELFEEKLICFWREVDKKWVENGKKKIAVDDHVIKQNIERIVNDIIDKEHHIHPFIFFLSSDDISINKYYGKRKAPYIRSIIAGLLSGRKTQWKYLVYSVNDNQDEICRIFTEQVIKTMNIKSWLGLTCSNHIKHLERDKNKEPRMPREIRNKMDLILWENELAQCKITKDRWEQIEDWCPLVRLGTKNYILKDMLDYLYKKSDVSSKKWFWIIIHKYIKRLMAGGVEDSIVKNNKELLITFYMKITKCKK